MTDQEAIRGVVLDYIDGWFDGDAVRMERALHPELVKRCRGIEGDDPDAVRGQQPRHIRELSEHEGVSVPGPPIGAAEPGHEGVGDVVVAQRAPQQRQHPVDACIEDVEVESGAQSCPVRHDSRAVPQGDPQQEFLVFGRQDDAPRSATPHAVRSSVAAHR